MIIYIPNGDIFESDAEAIVNPVNCVGIMGKGLALEFKNRYPLMFEAYRQEVQTRRMRIGHCHIYRADARAIINFPTKYHWRDQSTLGAITRGLEDLRHIIGRRRIKSIAIPMLGCGLGGLSWDDVRDQIDDILGDLECEIEIYGPPEVAKNER